ncbi:MAG: restriction endonuclease subunit S [Desulfosporosinus sp.]
MSINGWKEVKLEEVGTVVTGKTPSSKTPDHFGDVIPFVTPTDFKNYHKQIFSADRYLSQKGKDGLKGKVLPDNSVVVTCIGSDMGKVALNSVECVTNQQINSIIINKEKVDANFLYYKISNMYEYIKQLARGGTTMPIVNKGTFEQINIELPSLIEQKAIANTLLCLDDKIELNNRINKNLEEMAQALFKSWFIDFEPFQDSEFKDSELGRIPKGWRVESLGNIADYLNGLAMQKFRTETDEFLPVIKIKELNQGFIDESSDKASVNIPKQYIINDGDVIFSWSGTLMVKIWTGGKGGLNQHLFKVTSRNYDKWFYYLWTLKHLEKFKAIAQDKATTMGHIKRSHIKESKVIIPSDLDMKVLSNLMNPIIEKIIELCIQNQTLKVIRNSLLPKLMSGEIRVPLEEVQ